MSNQARQLMANNKQPPSLACPLPWLAPALAEQRNNLLQFPANGFEGSGSCRARKKIGLNRSWSRFRASGRLPRPRASAMSLHVEMIPSTFNREALIVQEPLNFKNRLHVFPPVETVASAGFFRRKLWKFAFPKTQDKGLHANQLAHIANAKVKLIWNFWGWRRWR